MRLLVCGGRDFKDKEAVRRGIFDAVDLWYESQKLPPPDDFSGVTIIQGMARGADRLAYKLTLELGAIPECYPITPDDWDTYGHAAGPIRNRYMLAQSKPDFGLVMNGGNGTHDMAELLRKAGVLTLDKRHGAPAPTPRTRKPLKRLPAHRK